MEKVCSSVMMLVTVMAISFACMAMPKTEAKPDPRPDNHEVGSVWPDNVMIMSSNIERSEGDVVESKGDVNVSTPEVAVTSSEDSFITETIIEINPTTNSSIKTDVDTIKAEEEVTVKSVPAADEEAIPTVESLPVIVEEVDQQSTLDEKISIVKTDDGVSVNSTLGKVVDGNCSFNLAIPNRNMPSITYSTNCDFRNHDMYTLICIPDAFTCASLCAGDSRCTHFTYHDSPLTGRTCRLKNAPGSGGSWASSVKAPSSYVCGYIGKRALNNIMLGLCLSLDINVDIE